MYGSRDVPFFFLYSASSGVAMSFSNTLVLFVSISSDFYNKPPPHAAAEETESWAKKTKTIQNMRCAQRNRKKKKRKKQGAQVVCE